VNLFSYLWYFTVYRLHINDIIKSRPKNPGTPLENISGYATELRFDVLCTTVVLNGMHANVSTSYICMFMFVRFRFYLLIFVEFCSVEDFVCVFFVSLRVFSARCNIYISRLCYDASVRLSVRLSAMEVHWRIIANLGFKFRSQFTAHCALGSRCMRARGKGSSLGRVEGSSCAMLATARPSCFCCYIALPLL